MSAQIIDGKQLALTRQEIVRQTILEYTNQGHRPPGLCVIQVGDNPASTAYVGRKQTTCELVGIYSKVHQFPTTVSEYDVLKLIRQLNEDETVDGIIVQCPLPPHIRTLKINEAIDPKKDIDGFHPYNVGRLALRDPAMRPATPYGIIQILNSIGEVYKGRHAVVVGASNIVGRPMTLELLLAGATVSVAHRFTEKLHRLTSKADVLIVAVGRAGFIGSPFVKEGATVIDVGITRTADGRIVGDVKKTVAEKVAYITPVPGGVGPMTVCMLIENCLQAYELTLQS